jgi:hypothetical protein
MFFSYFKAFCRQSRINASAEVNAIALTDSKSVWQEPCERIKGLRRSTDMETGLAAGRDSFGFLEQLLLLATRRREKWKRRLPR